MVEPQSPGDRIRDNFFSIVLAYILQFLLKMRKFVLYKKVHCSFDLITV